MARAQLAGIAIELSSSQSQPAGCVASFLIDNRTGQTLDRFNVDLLVLDTKGEIADRVIVDLAPLRGGPTRIDSFALTPHDCDAIGSLVVHDIPECRAADTQTQLDCMKGLSVSSQSPIGLEH